MNPAVRTLFLCVALFGCYTASSHVFETPGVTPLDARDRKKAELIANYYFEIFEPHGGGVSFKRDDGDFWIFATHTGRKHTAGADILVRKDGSTITRNGAPEVKLMDGLWKYEN